MCWLSTTFHHNKRRLQFTVHLLVPEILLEFSETSLFFGENTSVKCPERVNLFCLLSFVKLFD